MQETATINRQELRIRNVWQPVVREYFIEYVDTYKARRITARTVRQYANEVCRFLKWLKDRAETGPNRTWKDFSREDVIDYLRTRSRAIGKRSHEEISPQTARQALKGAVHFSEWLHETGQRTDNPSIGITWAAFMNRPGTPLPPQPTAFDFSKTASAEEIVKLSPGEVAEIFARDVVMNGGSVSYAKVAKHDIRAFLLWMAEGRKKPLIELDESDVAAYIDRQRQTLSLHGRLRSPNTVKSIWKKIRKFCKWLVRAGVIAKNPTDGLKGPRQARVLVPPLPDGVFEKAIESSAFGETPMLKARNRFIVTFYAYTGARLSELMSLRRDQIEGRESVVITGKGARQREIALHLQVRATLAAYLAERADRCSDLVVDHYGRPVKKPVTMIKTLMQRLSDRIGHRVRAHDFRRTYFTKLARSKAEWHVIKAIGGWSSTDAALSYIWMAARELGIQTQQTFDPLQSLATPRTATGQTAVAAAG